MIDRRQDQRDGGHDWATKRIANNPFWSGVLAAMPDFETFVTKGPERFGRLRTPQIDYLRTGDRRADFIGRTESFGADLATVCDRLGIQPPPEAPRRNAGPSSSYRDHYTPAMRQRVAELFEPDLREFGYEF